MSTNLIHWILSKTGEELWIKTVCYYFSVEKLLGTNWTGQHRHRTRGGCDGVHGFQRRHQIGQSALCEQLGAQIIAARGDQADQPRRHCACLRIGSHNTVSLESGSDMGAQVTAARDDPTYAAIRVPEAIFLNLCQVSELGEPLDGPDPAITPDAVGSGMQNRGNLPSHWPWMLPWQWP